MFPDFSLPRHVNILEKKGGGEIVENTQKYPKDGFCKFSLNYLKQRNHKMEAKKTPKTVSKKYKKENKRLIKEQEDGDNNTIVHPP